MQLPLKCKIFRIQITYSIISRLLCFKLQFICTQLPFTYWAVQSFQLCLILLLFLSLTFSIIIFGFITGLDNHIFDTCEIYPTKNFFLTVLFLEQLFVFFLVTFCRCPCALSFYCLIMMIFIKLSYHANRCT
jgi:hypothetical protein